MSKFKIASEIDFDIQSGVYALFPKLKDRLEHISLKLVRSVYVINAESQLTEGEAKTLIENGYVNEWDIDQLVEP